MSGDRPAGRHITLNNGRQVFINYRWGNSTDLMPTGALVTTKGMDDQDLVVVVIDGPFDDFEQVFTLCVQAANDWCLKSGV